MCGGLLAKGWRLRLWRCWLRFLYVLLFKFIYFFLWRYYIIFPFDLLNGINCCGIFYFFSGIELWVVGLSVEGGGYFIGCIVFLVKC